MWLTDPRVMLLGAGAALVASEHGRKLVGRGIGYVAAGTMKVGGPVAHAAEDIFDEASHVAGHNGASATPKRSRAKSSAAH